MAVDKTVTTGNRATGAITLVANTAYTVVFADDADYVEIVNTDSTNPLYVTIGTAEDEITVTDLGVHAVAPSSTGRFTTFAGAYVNVESAGTPTIVMQLQDTV